MLLKYSPDSKAHLRLATGGFQGEVFIKIISGEPRPRAWEEVREAREVAFILRLFITCNLDGVSVLGERWSNLLSGGHIITPFCQCWQLRIQLKLNTALLSHCPSVRPCVTGVTSHISHIYKGINAMLIIRGPIKPYTGWFLNWSARFSVPKWKTSCSQPGLVFHEIMRR